jgi:hypothetical protein
MALTAEGTLEIPMEEFWNWVFTSYGVGGMVSLYGIPRFNKNTNSIEITVAMGDQTNPNEWATKPKALLEWSEKTVDVPN